MPRALLLPLLAFALFGAACRSATQITIEVTTDLPCKDLGSTSITVGTIDALETKFPTSVTSHCEAGRVGALVVVPSGDDGAELALRVVSGLRGKDPDACVREGYAGDCIVARRAIHFSPHTSRTVDVVMRNVCAGVACVEPGTFSTCVQGTCVAAQCANDDCSEGALAPGVTPSTDAGPDATITDAGPDAIADAGPDAPIVDAGPDARPPTAWLSMAAAPPELAPRADHVAVWTGNLMLVWGGALDTQFANDGASYDPKADTWALLPAALLGGRNRHTAVWTGNEMIVWGGANAAADGARYDPVGGAWRQLPAPPISGRSGHTAVWATSTNEMIVWGGDDGNAFLADGAAYSPSGNAWRTLAAAPIAGRNGHGAVWNGSRMIVFGGTGCGSLCGDASSYDPVQDKWIPITQPPGSLDARIHPGAVATGANGTRATFFGGGVNGVGGARSTGASFDGATNAWAPIEGLGTAMLPDPAREAALVWWGAGRLWLWGGEGPGGVTDTRNDGASYDPALDQWSKMLPGGPSKRSHASVVWTGTEAILWGGTADAAHGLGDGKRFRP